AVSAGIVPASLLLCSAFIYLPGKRWRSFFMNTLVMVALPVVVLLVISQKNRRSGTGEALTSNKGGPAMMMVVQRAYNYDTVRIRKAIADEPGWYLWAYDHATVPINEQTGSPYENWLNLSQAFGICFFGAQKDSGIGIWRFNFSPLLNYLRNSGPAALIDPVRQDSADALIRPYRFAGYSPELNPRWIGIYGDVSKKIYFKTIIREPLGMLRAFVVQQAIFAAYGPLFPLNTTQNKPGLLVRSGLRTSKDPLPLGALLVVICVLFAVMSWITYAIVLLNLLLLFFRIWTKKLIRFSMEFSLFSIPLLLIAIVFSCLVGGENDRYFMQAAPYITILAALLPASLDQKQKLRHQHVHYTG
ncbi:MAG: hypothetical protein JO301_11790, partial [Chitinophagaceae bacterium]|nr:hypothetical protein [Chitinophagaceae bacterium]